MSWPWQVSLGCCWDSLGSWAGLGQGCPLCLVTLLSLLVGEANQVSIGFFPLSAVHTVNLLSWDCPPFVCSADTIVFHERDFLQNSLHTPGLQCAGSK